MLLSALLASHFSLLLIFFTRCLLHVVRSLLLFFAVDSSLLAASFLLFTDLYSLLASRWSVLSSSCLIIISLSSPLAVICMLYITWCMLFVIPKLAAHTCRSLIAVRKPWIVARCSLCVTRFSLPSPPSVAAECLIFALRCSLIIYHSYLLASHTFFLNARSSLKEVCCIPIAYRFSVLGSCFALLTACYPVLLSGSLLLATFSFLIIRSLLFTRYSLLAVYGLSLLRFSLIAAAALYLMFAA